ncbi:MAG: hypothetical protein H6686_07670 [Fibrobacteria bacterium]|nr:hypothetical protein [Fibrobacteria bacterium]
MTESLTQETWLQERTFEPSSPLTGRLPGRLQTAGLTVDAVLLARNASATLGRHLLTLRHGWPGGRSPFTEILVCDLGSSDSTCEIATAGGGTLLLPEGGDSARLSPAADGEGVLQALAHSQADILLVMPAELLRLDMDALAAMVGAFLDFPSLQMVLGFEDASGNELSRLLCRPLLSTLLPELSLIADPACPLFAIRRKHFSDLPLARTSGFQAALMVDVWRIGGLEALAQVRIPRLERETNAASDHGQEFRCALALLEALRRSQRFSTPRELGHMATTLVDSPTGSGLLARTRLEVFPWRESPL